MLTQEIRFRDLLQCHFVNPDTGMLIGKVFYLQVLPDEGDEISLDGNTIYKVEKGRFISANDSNYPIYGIYVRETK